jgi:hypothetical protein
MGLRLLSFMMSVAPFEGEVGFQSQHHHTRGNIIVGRAFSFHVVVVAGVSEAHVLRLLGEGWLKLPSPLDAMRNSSVESSIVACCGVDAP